MEIPDNIFDAYDGKATLYTAKPSSYKKNDLWVLNVENANGSNNTYPKYKKGTLLTAS
jgi:hypothetical protein